ncbi:MAG: AMP-binding protein, partial [Pseudomonadales bacterium]|nr:AMP-binding protein [Pseudomonadales bacterium]
MLAATGNEWIQREGQRFARLLDAAGVGRDAVVALLLPNIPEFLACYRGITWSGRTAVPLNHNLPADDAAYVLRNSGAQALVAHPQYGATALELAPLVDPRGSFAAGAGIAGFRPLDEMAAYSDAPLDAPRAGHLMLYTSGTTGQPKGVVIEGAGEPLAAPPGLVSRRSMEMLHLFLHGEAPGTHLVAGPLYHAGPLSYCEG